MSAVCLALLITAAMFAVVFGIFYIIDQLPK